MVSRVLVPYEEKGKSHRMPKVQNTRLRAVAAACTSQLVHCVGILTSGLDSASN